MSLSSTVRLATLRSTRPYSATRGNVSKLGSSRVFARHYSTPHPAPPPAKWSAALKRFPAVFTVLLGAGIATTGFGLYEYYNSFNIWPEELRADLRAGIKAKHQDDLSMSVRFMHRAYQTSLTLPSSVYGSEPHLKLSGIAISYAEILESMGRPREAYEVYLDALQRIRHAQRPDPQAPAPHFLPMPPPTVRERMRAVALASKLGAMAEEYNLPSSEEESVLTFAVEEMLRVMKEVGGEPSSLYEKVFGKATTNAARQEQTVALSNLELPHWVSTADVGAPLEALAAFYARMRQYDYAMPLYLQATSMLIPAPPKTSPSEDRCRGAQMMLSLADVIIKALEEKHEHATVHQAQAWATKALDVVVSTRGAALAEAPRKTSSQDADGAPHICEETLIAALYSLGTIAEMEDRPQDAITFFTQSAAQATRSGLRELSTEAKGAARQVERAQRIQRVTPGTTK